MNVAVKPAKHSAAGQYLGFALQPVRLCYHLLTCGTDEKVSLELLDDVGVHHVDGSFTLEQIKSALKHNPISDWAPDLWKAIANWLASDVGNNSCRYQIYVTPVHLEGWSQALTNAQSNEEVAELVSSISSALAKLRKPPACIEFLQKFLDAPPADQFKLISNLTIISADADPVEPLRALIRVAVDPALVDTLCQAAIGIAKEKADRLIRDGQPPILDGNEFKAEFRRFVKRNNIPGYLASLTPVPNEHSVASTLSTRPTFIRQLELIKVSEDERVRAVSDYLRASADKSKWAEAGLVFEGSLDEWDGDLRHRHSLVAGEVEDTHTEKSGVLKGRLVYRKCAQLQAPLEGRVVPSHFVNGCFNSLADELHLGWHPDFKSLLDVEDQ